MEPLLLPDREAAELVGIGRTKLLEEWRQGRLRAVYIGRRRLFPVGELRAYVEELRAQQHAGHPSVEED